MQLKPQNKRLKELKVNMSISEEKRAACEQILESLKHLYASGSIVSGQYYKGLVTVAYEYAKEYEIPDCLLVLSYIPPEYILNEMSKDLDEDDLFREVSFKLSEILEKSGTVSLLPDIVTNMNPASA